MIKGKEKILIVDDEEMIIEVGAQMLVALGYEIKTARSRRGAVEKFKEMHEELDLVILDMNMPGMDGEETFDALKDIDDEVKVILSSGYILNQEDSVIFQRGCLGFLQKPFDLQFLSNTIRQVLEQ